MPRRSALPRGGALVSRGSPEAGAELKSPSQFSGATGAEHGVQNPRATADIHSRRIPNFPDETHTSFFLNKMYLSSLELKNKSMYKTGRDWPSPTPCRFPPGTSRRFPEGWKRSCSVLRPVWSGRGRGSVFTDKSRTFMSWTPGAREMRKISRFRQQHVKFFGVGDLDCQRMQL